MISLYLFLTPMWGSFLIHCADVGNEEMGLANFETEKPMIVHL